MFGGVIQFTRTSCKFELTIASGTPPSGCAAAKPSSNSTPALRQCGEDQLHFDTRTAAERETTQSFNMIDQLYRRVQLLDVDTVAEELRLEIFDRADTA